MAKGDSSSNAIAFFCITCFTCLTLADDSVPCGFTVCNPRGYVFCAKPPLIDEGDDPYCVGCETQQEQCEKFAAQPGCEKFCEDYLIKKWGCNNTENVSDQNKTEDNNTISLDKRTVIVLLVVISCAFFGVSTLATFLCLDRVGILNLPCWLPIFSRKKTKRKGTKPKEPSAPAEVARLINPTPSLHNEDETSLKTTSGADARRSSSDGDSTSNTSNTSHTSNTCHTFNNIPATNLNGKHTDEIAVG